jgi:uncharacterized DUF497 family protein
MPYDGDITMIEFDPHKDARNIAVHGISLAAAETLLSGFIVEQTDDRFDYGEVRIIAIGEIDGRVFVCVYTKRGGLYRPISLRPAKKRERDAYAQAKAGG